MLSVVTYLWNDPLMGVAPPAEKADVRVDLRPSARDRRRGFSGPNFRRGGQVVPMAGKPVRSFKHEHVVRLARLFRKHLTVPHRFVCVTDEVPATPAGFDRPDPYVVWVPTPPEALALGELRSPEGYRFPSCYRRLWSFSKEAREVLGERMLLTDIDAVPVRNMDPIVSRKEDFVGWRPFRDWGRKLRIGGGTYLMTTGSHCEVYDDFITSPHEAIRRAKDAGFRGSDQAWLSYKLADKVPHYALDSGIYSIRDLGHDHRLPPDARLVHFNGNAKPWSYTGRGDWVAKHWNAV